MSSMYTLDEDKRMRVLWKQSIVWMKTQTIVMLRTGLINMDASDREHGEALQHAQNASKTLTVLWV